MAYLDRTEMIGFCPFYHDTWVDDSTLCYLKLTGIYYMPYTHPLLNLEEIVNGNISVIGHA